MGHLVSLVFQNPQNSYLLRRCLELLKAQEVFARKTRVFSCVGTVDGRNPAPVDIVNIPLFN